MSSIDDEGKEQSILKLVDLVKKLPGVDWNFNYLIKNENINLTDIIENPFLLEESNLYHLTENPNLTFEFVLNNLDDVKNSWNWTELSHSKNISFEDIMSHPELPWNYSNVSIREDVDFEYVRTHPELKWDFNNLSVHTPIDVISENLDLPWNYLRISLNETITLRFVLAHINERWDWLGLSERINIADVQSHPELPWNFNHLSVNETLTTDFFLANLAKNWDTLIISTNTNLDFDRLADIQFNWDYDQLTQNPSLTKKFIKQHLEDFNTDSMWFWIYTYGTVALKDIDQDEDLFWNYTVLSAHLNLTAEYVLYSGAGREEWDEELLSKNEALTVTDFELLKENGFYLNYYWLSLHPTITYDFIYKNREKGWYWSNVSINTFNYEKWKAELIDKIKANYLKRKKKHGYTVLDSYIIPDLNKIVLEY